MGKTPGKIAIPLDDVIKYYYAEFADSVIYHLFSPQLFMRSIQVPNPRVKLICMRLRRSPRHLSSFLSLLFSWQASVRSSRWMIPSFELVSDDPSPSLR